MKGLFTSTERNIAHLPTVELNYPVDLVHRRPPPSELRDFSAGPLPRFLFDSRISSSLVGQNSAVENSA